MTVTVDTPTDTISTDGAAVTEADQPVAAPAASPDPQPAPSVRSDDELLAVLEREIERTGARPTRKDVMALTGAGTGRASRLLATVNEQHGWNGTTARKRGTPTRGARPGGTGPRSRPRTTPAANASPASPPETGPDTPVTGQSAPDTPAPAPAAAPVPAPTATHAGRLVAWVGFVFGSVTSVAANVLAARIPPMHAPAGWTPSLTAEVGAAVWPLALLLSVEVLSRVRMPSDWYWKLAKVGGSIAVAGGSAVISYGHIHDVLLTWRYSGAGAGVGPLVIDGLMVLSGFGLLAISRRPVPRADTGTGTAPVDTDRA